MFTSARSRILAAALALGMLGSIAPATAAPLGPDVGLRGGSSDVLAVQYGYGGGRHHHHHGGWGHHRHHGHHWGHHRGRHWGRHGGRHRHHHHHHHGHW